MSTREYLTILVAVLAFVIFGLLLCKYQEARDEQRWNPKVISR